MLDLSLVALILGVVAAAPPSAPAASTPEDEPLGPVGHFVRFQPLSLAELYAKRMRFWRGEPMISVGLMEEQETVSVSSETALRLMFDEGEVPKTIYADPGSRFIMKPLGAESGSIRHWVIVHASPFQNRAQAEKSETEWKLKGQNTRLFDVGTIISVRGNVLDTRQWEVGVGGTRSREEAESLMRQLTAEGQSRLFLHEELISPPRGSVGIYSDRGVLLHRAKDSVYLGTVESGRMKVHAVEFSRGYKNHGREDRSYFGHVYVALDRSGRLAAINSVPAEQLLAGLVPAEIFPNAPLEALKAQSVTARGEIFSKLGHRHFGEPYHLCSEQHCQVYAGAGQEQALTSRAVLETRGLLAFRPRTNADPLELVDSVYSSSCGGFSEANEVVWGTPPSPSLRPHLDASANDPSLSVFEPGLDEHNLRSFLESYPPTSCARASFAQPDRYRWKKSFSAAELDRIVARLGVGHLKNLEVLGRGKGGRITGLRVSGTSGTTEVLQELPVRRLFGNLYSGLFVLDLARDKKGEIESAQFIGGGWGHGVGMCQMGAIGRAERGQDFKQILSHYYSGAITEQIY